MTSLTETDAQAAQQLVERVFYELKKVIVGQEHLLERLLVAVIAQGHVLVEGAPGLAKTLTLKTLAQVLSVDFKRIQFTPDLLPTDLMGTRIYNPTTHQFSTETGPLFAHFVLADEINRAPAKVQSALLEAMEEGQVTLGRETHALPQPFLVMATQNPLESEGTYPLPEAQLDRFLMKLLVDYPNHREETAILQRMTGQSVPAVSAILTAEQLQQLTHQAEQVYVDPKLMHAIVDVVLMTRPGVLVESGSAEPALKSTLVTAGIQTGASPRGSLAITRCAKALALIRGRTYVTPQDVHEVALDCLRHRLILSYEALTKGQTADSILNGIINPVLRPLLSQVSAPQVLPSESTPVATAEVEA